MHQDYADKLAREAAIILSAAETFCIAEDAIVKVQRWDGPWVPLRLDEVLKRMKHPKPPRQERLDKRNNSETRKQNEPYHSITSGTQGAITEAKQFLLSMLAEGPRLANEMIAESHDAGIKPATLYRAKGEHGVLSDKIGLNDGWMWVLPEGDHTPNTQKP